MKTIYADLHLWGVSPIEIDFEYGPDIYYIGDIIDRAKCRKDELPYAEKAYETLVAMAGKNFISGNHETGFYNTFHVHEGVYYTHGDMDFWSAEKAEKYRAQPMGAGVFERLGSKMFDIGRKLFPAKLTKKQKEKVCKRCKLYNCHTYVSGHKHPKKIIDIVYKGIRIIVLPRGKHQIKV